MSAPEVREYNDEIVYGWPEDGLALRFSQFHMTDAGAIRAHCTAQAIRPDATWSWWNQVTLGTQSDRNRCAEKLGERSRGGAKAWIEDIDNAFQDAARRYLAVPPPVDLADDDGEADLDLQYALEPVVLLNQVNMFLADQSSTKSYLMLYLAVCIAAGRSSIFGDPTIEGPVQIFDWEVDRQLQRHRLGWICRGLKMPIPRGILYANMADRGRIMDRGREMRQSLARSGAVATVVDSLTFGAGGDLNTSEIAGPTVAAIGGLGANVTKLVTAHPPKSSRRPSNGDEVSAIGSGLFEFRPRSIWRMQAPARHARGDSFVVSMTDRKGSESGVQPQQFYRIAFDKGARAVTFKRMTQEALIEERKEAGTGEERMLEALSKHPRNTNEIARELHTSAGTVRNYARELVAKGLVVKIGGGTGETAVWASNQPSMLSPRPTKTRSSRGRA